MRRTHLAILFCAAATLISMRAAFPATWGPVEPKWQMVIDYRGTVAVLDHDLTEFACRAALPYGDRQMQVTFSCEREA